MDYMAQQVFKSIGKSLTKLNEATIKTIKVLFPIPREHNIIWADVDFGRRISGMVLTDVGVFIRGNDSKNAYHYFRWEHFDKNDFEIKKNSSGNDIYFNKEKILSVSIENKFFPCYHSAYVDIMKESSVAAGDVFAAVEAVTPENFAAVNNNKAHGQMVEEALTLLDKLSGQDATVVGRNNKKDGSDRLVDGFQIQTKYHSSGKSCINSCFDKATGNFRYIDSNGNLMLIEVPKDKYAEAVNEFRKKIIEGKVPGVTDPNEASKYIKQGRLTYQQALNLCKPGTIESLTYDAATGVITCSFAFGLTFLVTFIFSYVQTNKRDDAMYSAFLAGIQVFGLSFFAHILTQQVARTNLTKQLIPLSEYLVRKMGYKAVQGLVNAMRGLSGKTAISGAAAMKQLSKILRSNVVVSAITIIVFSIPNLYNAFNQRVSKAQFTKNMLSLVGTTAAAGGGTVATALVTAKIATALGTTIAPGVGTAIGLLGGLVFGGIGGTVIKVCGDIVREDDSVILFRMFNGIVVNMCYEYMLQESEIDVLIEKFDSIKPREFKKLFESVMASKTQEKEISNFIRHYYEELIRRRPVVKEPAPKDLLLLAERLEKELLSTQEKLNSV